MRRYDSIGDSVGDGVVALAGAICTIRGDCAELRITGGLIKKLLQHERVDVAPDQSASGLSIAWQGPRSCDMHDDMRVQRSMLE